MNFGQWISDGHRYRDGYEEGERGDEGEGGGLDHFDGGMLVLVGLETFRNRRIC